MSQESELDPLAIQRIAEISGILLAQSPHDERRSVPRQSFRAQESVAPYADARIPRISEFRRVPCIDISTQGIAFIWPTEPDFHHVVVALGRPPDVVCLSARVVNRRPHAECGGFRVGCRFLGRVVPPDS